jgi:hypothetical protein
VKRTAGLLVLAALLLAGCGAYTKKDFIASADAICASAVRQTRSVAPPAFTSSKKEQLSALASYLAKVLPIVQSEDTHIRALRRPSQGARQRALLARYLAALRQTVSDYQDLAAAAKQGDAASVAGAEGVLHDSPVTSLAASYGLRSCETPGATVA